MSVEILTPTNRVNPSRFCSPIITLLPEEHLGDAGPALGLDHIHLALELTRQCNLFCKHCYVSARSDISDQFRVSAETWLKCLTDARHGGISSVQMIGGEATLHPALLRLVNRAGELLFRDIEVFSNATRLNAELLHAMRRSEASLATSLYGATAEQHDGFTRVTGSFARTCRNIRHALDQGISVRVAVVGYELDGRIVQETSQFARQLGVHKVSTDVVRTFGRGKSGGNRFKDCDACGVSVLRICSDGVISGCAMSREPSLGHVSAGVEAVLRKLAERRWARAHSVSAAT